jgi:MYXO-CTERM domain-containing protein
MKVVLILTGLIALAAPVLADPGNGNGNAYGFQNGVGNPHASAAPSPVMDIGLAALAMVGVAAFLARRKSR